MTRYYFHLRRHDGEVLSDERGAECHDLAFAVAEARSGIREMIAQATRADGLILAEAMLVADEDGRTLETIPLVTESRDPKKDKLQ